MPTTKADDATSLPSANKKLFQLPAGFDPFVPVRVSGNLLPTKNSGLHKTAVKPARVSLEGKIGSIVDARNYRGNGHWEWDQTDMLGTGKNTGFIYVICDLVESRLYLGKKQFVGAGKINKGQQSNWQWYISSSTELSASVKMNGKENFRFVAIEQYKSKGALSYAEVWSLLHVQSPVFKHKWYNILINKVSWRVSEPPTQRHRERLHKLMDEFGAYYDGQPIENDDTI